MKNRCKQLDIFGQSIALNYKGRNTYQTTLGACLSLPLLVTVALAFCLKGFNEWANLSSLKRINVAPLQYSEEAIALTDSENPM